MKVEETARNSLILFSLLLLVLLPRPAAGLIFHQAAVRLESAGEMGDAALAYADAARRIPWQKTLWEQAGRAAWAAGESTQAIQFLGSAAQTQGLTTNGWLLLAEAHQQVGEDDAAIQAWSAALPAWQAYLELAHSSRSIGDLDRAVDLLQELNRTDPGHAGAHYLLGLLLMATTPQEALPELMTAAQLDQDLDPTVQGLRKSMNTALLASDPAAHFLAAGQALAALGEWDLAAVSFQRSIQVDGGSAESWAWWGEAQQHLGDSGGEQLEMALDLGADNALVQGLYGLHLQRQDKVEAAMAAFERAAALDPGNPAWQLALGGAAAQAGDLVAGFGYYLKAVDLGKEDPAAWRALAEFSVINGVAVPESGLPAARKIITLAPADWRSYDLAGQAALFLNQFPAAEIYFLKAIRLDASQAAPCLHLALVYLETGRRDLAQTYLIRARNFDPQSAVGWQAERLLEEHFP